MRTSFVLPNSIAVAVLATLTSTTAIPLPDSLVKLFPRLGDCDKSKPPSGGSANANANDNGNGNTNMQPGPRPQGQGQSQGANQASAIGFNNAALGREAGAEGRQRGGRDNVVWVTEWVTKTIHRSQGMGGDGQANAGGGGRPRPTGGNAPAPQPAPAPTPQPASAPAPQPTPQPEPQPEPQPQPQNPGSGSGIQAMVGLHNDFRAQYGAGPVTWDDTLANYATNYYQGKCSAMNLKHSGGPYGENLSGSSGDMDAAGGFGLWANEDKLYDWNNPGFSHEAGHFTQVVWKATERIGCATLQCGDGTLIACEYAPAGNMVGDDGQYFRDNVGTKQ